MTLYELTSDYLNLLELAEDPDIDEQAFLDTLEGIEGALEDKADNYAKCMRMLEADANGIKAEEERLAKRRKTIEGNVSRMKSALQYAMEATGKTKFKTQLFSFTVRNNAESVIIDTDNIRNIPDQYLKFKEPEADKAAIKKAIKEGDEDTQKALLKLCHLERTKSLLIK
jgi:uncharacterized protein YoxC